MNKLTFFGLLLFVFIIPSAIEDSYACSCVSPIDYDLAIAEAELVYSGTVIDVIKENDRHVVTFDIKNVEKGDVPPIHTLDEESLGGYACGVEYQKGITYRVFENKPLALINNEIDSSDPNEPVEPKFPDLKTNICTTTNAFFMNPTSAKDISPIVFVFYVIILLAVVITICVWLGRKKEPLNL